MQERKLGGTGVKVSALCFGTMNFGGEADEAASAALFARCRDVGITFFDCADAYQQGRSEEVLGRLMAGCRDELVLTSKAFRQMGTDPNARGSSRWHLLKAVEDSLRRLRTDRIDIYYLHRFDPETRLEDTLRALDDLVRAGKVLYVGASNFAAWQAQKALDLCDRHHWVPFAATQPMYNLLKRTAEVEVLPQAADAGLAVMAYGPLAGGLLSGKYGRDRRPEEGRMLSNTAYQRRYEAEWVPAAVERFCAFAAEHGWHPASLAVAWVASHPAVTAPVIGATRPEQIDDIARSLEIPMTPELRAEISALTPTPPPPHDRNDEV